MHMFCLLTGKKPVSSSSAIHDSTLMPYAALYDLLQVNLKQPFLYSSGFWSHILVAFFLFQQKVGESGELSLGLQGGTNEGGMPFIWPKISSVQMAPAQITLARKWDNSDHRKNTAPPYAKPPDLLFSKALIGAQWYYNPVIFAICLM